MKIFHKFNKVKWSEVIFILVIAFIISTFNLIHVIIGYAKTPVNGLYMATGHYYLDYFEYLQEIAQGMRSNWLSMSTVASEHNAIFYQSFPYIIIGKIAHLLFLSPIQGYWGSVFILCLTEILLIYYAVCKIIPHKPFLIKVGALLLAIFATPFLQMNLNAANLVIGTYDFWYSPSSIFTRIGVVPYHILSTVIVLIDLIIISSAIEKIDRDLYDNLISKSIIVSVLMIIVLFFSPFNILTLTVSLLFIFIYYGLFFLYKKRYLGIMKLFILGLPIVVMVIPSAIFIKYLYSSVFKNLQIVETQWIHYYSIKDVLLNIGPILIFVPFGLKSFFRKFNAFGITFFFFCVASYLLFSSKLAFYLGTHNLRFLSGLNYLIFGCLAILGIDAVSSFVYKRAKNLIIFFILFILLTYFSLGNWYFLNNILHDGNLFSSISYLPKGIIEGFKYLDKSSDNKVVLTAPGIFLGIVLPIFADHEVYIGRPGVLGYPLKANLADLFYLGKMTDIDGYDFLRANNIGYVILTSIEGYSVKDISKYPFLKLIYSNKDIIIYKLR